MFSMRDVRPEENTYMNSSRASLRKAAWKFRSVHVSDCFINKYVQGFIEAATTKHLFPSEEQ